MLFRTCSLLLWLNFSPIFYNYRCYFIFTTKLLDARYRLTVCYVLVTVQLCLL